TRWRFGCMEAHFCMELTLFAHRIDILLQVLKLFYKRLIKGFTHADKMPKFIHNGANFNRYRLQLQYRKQLMNALIPNREATFIAALLEHLFAPAAYIL